ncbi:MAG TPA: DUF418 domain-containing protein [Burkholderiaceae bacterium]|nr:DUF418 domain-containing protein [Burkholderiaceae bacterium]
MAAPDAPRSLPRAERLPTLDILRGFALMGILIMNMPGFNSSFFAEGDGSHLWPGAIDQGAEMLREALFSGKFNSMFSMLFGIGFTIQFGRMAERDPAHATRIYLRRLGVLAVLGVLHAWVFWPGDVLHTYAILGLLLVLGLRRVSDRGIMLLIAACIVYPALSGLLRVALFTPELTAERVQIAKAFEASNNAAFGHGGFLAMVRENTRVMNFFYDNWLSLWGTVGWWVMMSLTMLIGLLAGRRRWVQRATELMPQIRRLTWWALFVGLACGVAFTTIFELNRAPGPSPIKVLGGVCYSLSRLGLMIFYVLVIVRLAQRADWRRRLAPLATAGRMPLTNYLLQTAICLTLFQSWGFGLWMKVGPALSLVLALAIFWLVQVPLSAWWLARHERGPMEALWARLTYGPRGDTAAAPLPAAAAGPH